MAVDELSLREVKVELLDGERCENLDGYRVFIGISRHGFHLAQCAEHGRCRLSESVFSRKESLDRL